MLDNAKTYLVEVVLRKYGPTAISAAISYLFIFLAAHQNVLQSWGLTFGTWPLQWPAGQEPSGHVILLELDTMSVPLLATVGALAAVFFRAMGHHATAAVIGKPQDGDVRDPHAPALPGGDRQGDPK